MLCFDQYRDGFYVKLILSFYLLKWSRFRIFLIAITYSIWMRHQEQRIVFHPTLLNTVLFLVASVLFFDKCLGLHPQTLVKINQKCGIMGHSGLASRKIQNMKVQLNHCVGSVYFEVFTSWSLGRMATNKCFKYFKKHIFRF